MFQAYKEYKAMSRGLPAADVGYVELNDANGVNDFEAFGGRGVRIG